MKKNRSLLVSKAAAEFIGTFALVFFGCGAVATAASVTGSFTPGGVAVVFGLVITVMIYALGHISGAHFNPAVTIAFASGMAFSSKRASHPGWKLFASKRKLTGDPPVCPLRATVSVCSPLRFGLQKPTANALAFVASSV